MAFWVYLMPIPTQNLVTSSKLPTEDTRISNSCVFTTILCEEQVQKLNRKLPKNVKKNLKILFSQCLGHSEDTFKRKWDISYFKKTSFGPSCTTSSFSNFSFCRIFPISNKNSQKLSAIDKNFVDILQSIFSHFPTEVCKCSFRSLIDYEFRLCWTFALQCTGKLFCCLSWNPGHENWEKSWNPGQNFSLMLSVSWIPRQCLSWIPRQYCCYNDTFAAALWLVR